MRAQMGDGVLDLGIGLSSRGEGKEMGPETQMSDNRESGAELSGRLG